MNEQIMKRLIIGVQRGATTGNIERAAESAAGEPMAVRGIANTFRIMHSGRVFLPTAFDRWLAATGGNINLPLLAMHGYAGSEAYPTIGRVTAVKADAGGLQFAGFIGSGTELMDETRTLVAQGILSGISVGWTTKQARYVRKSDADIDPWLKQQMERQGVEECYAYVDCELVEISLVDVPDDRDAKLVAAAMQRERDQGSGNGDQENAIQRAVETALKSQRAEFEQQITELWEKGKAELYEFIDAVAADPRSDYAAALLDAEADAACGHGAADHGPGGAQPGAKSSVVTELSARLAALK